MQQRHELRKAGLKITLPRLKILEILEGAKLRHLSAEDIYKDLLSSGEDIGLATVYGFLRNSRLPVSLRGITSRVDIPFLNSMMVTITTIWCALIRVTLLNS